MMIHTLVEEQAIRTPHAVAVARDGESLTYGELNRGANRLARRLQRLGVGPEKVVGVCAGRTLDLPLALLAVLKAGGAYLGLDPGYPTARLRFMLEGAHPKLVLTEERYLGVVAGVASSVLCLDRDARQWESESDEGASSRGGSDSLAYVVYTSGSTGRPKGVAIEHRGVVNYLAFLESEYGLSPADVVLPLSSISFDASVRELFGPLCVGARIEMLGGDALRDPYLVLDAIRARRVTALLAIVPTMLRALTTAAGEEGVAADSLRLLLTTGETLYTADWRRARASFCRRAEVVNQYGPTETTMTCTFHRAGPSDEGRDAIPAGRPIPGVRIYVLDAAGAVAPPGQIGEVHIAGAGISRGYLNQPELTAERFTPDPFVARRGARLYRSGDLGRILPDGSLEILGRTDAQQKVRGVRIEPEEVEAVLRGHPGVREVAVIVRWDRFNDSYLAACVVARDREGVTAGDLRHFAERELPRHLIPSAFALVQALPLTPNGKLDRQALAELDVSEHGSPAVPTAPSTPTECALVSIWADVLGLSHVGINDDFLRLGGHSLLAARIVARVRRDLGVDLPMTQLFDTPILASLASVIAERATTRSELNPPASKSRMNAPRTPEEASSPLDP